MRSALLFVLFTVVIKRPGLWAEQDFRPTPIPLDYWSEERGARSQSVDEQAAAVIPAHYWEDALRHSVYLTLVRDKIDQLIAKGEVVHPDSKPDHASKEVDDHDLWDRIKYAPFDRQPEEESSNQGDVTIMSRGRLVEEGSGYRFSEDEKNKLKCSNDSCTEGVKAFWSVKRMRQSQGETTPGKYHYELTFSVVTNQPKEKRKPYENPARTFTVRETGPSTIIDKPLEHRPMPLPKDGRAVWVHKNIVPKQTFHSRQYQNGLDRFFFSLFDDDEDDLPRKPKTTYVPQSYNQYSKVGYVNSPSESHQHKKLIPYPYKQHSIKYSRPPPMPPQPPNSHTPHYLDTDSIGVVSNHYMPQYSDNKYQEGKPPKGSRLPPPHPTQSQDNSTTEGPTTEKRKPEYAPTTDVPEIITGYHKHRPHPYKVSYYNPEHLRPPIFNAPPGVFVTMDKKPFKPMPPHRLHTKPIKAHKPQDFRPSPQLLDMHGFSEPDPAFDSAFRPINIKYDRSNSTGSSEVSSTETVQVAESSNKPKDNVLRKWNATETKPTRKHENKKAPKFTTTMPDIITAQSDEDDTDSMHWANLLGAFSKTTPMGAQKDKSKDTETTTPIPATTTTERPSTRAATTTEPPTTTTAAPKPKRTRPPPRFDLPKPTKVKKHKRVTTTTTTTTKAPSTEKPILRRPVPSDLMTQASSAATNKPKKWSPSSTSQSPIEYEDTTTTTTTTSTKKPTTTTTTTTSTTTTTTTDRSVISSFTTQKATTTPKPKNKNRYRQSTLMTKGTSVKHDKWSPSNVAETSNRPRTVLPPTGSFPKRKGSNFQGYSKPTTTRPTDYYDYDDHHSPMKEISTTPRTSTKSSIPKTTQATYEETVDQYDAMNQYSSAVQSSLLVDDSDEEEDDDEQDYEFNRKLTVSPSEKTNEIVEEENTTTEQMIVASPYSVAKNKTKCKKKNNSTTVSSSEIDFEDEQLLTTLPPPAASNETKPTSDLFDDLFGGFTLDDVTSTTEPSSGEELDNEASEQLERLTKTDDDFEDFLDEIEGKHADPRSEDSFYPEDESERDGLPAFDEEEDRESPRGSEYDEDDSPFSLLELMAME